MMIRINGSEGDMQVMYLLDKQADMGDQMIGLVTEEKEYHCFSSIEQLTPDEISVQSLSINQSHQFGSTPSLFEIHAQYSN